MRKLVASLALVIIASACSAAGAEHVGDVQTPRQPATIAPYGVAQGAAETAPAANVALWNTTVWNTEIARQMTERAAQIEAEQSRYQAPHGSVTPTGGYPTSCEGHYTSPANLMRESHCSYDAYNPSGCGGYGCIGLYQLSGQHYAPGGPCEGMGTDPAGQESCAAKISDNGANQSPWRL